MTDAKPNALAKLSKTSTVIRDVAGWAWPRRQLFWKQLRGAFEQAAAEAQAPAPASPKPARKRHHHVGHREGLIRTGTRYIRPRSMPCQ